MYLLELIVLMLSLFSRCVKRSKTETHYSWCLLGEVGGGSRKEVLYNAFVDARRSDEAVHEKLEKLFCRYFPEVASEKLGPS